jgi:alkyl sulfatase BDS1-like metallo-beta-lactamase superfamily hydrolase
MASCKLRRPFAREVLPRFAENRAEQEKAKADRLAAAADRALARRQAPRALPAPYPINEEAELAAARRAGQRPLRELAGQAGSAAGAALRGRLQAGTQRLAASASDARIEKLLGGTTAQRALFALLASRFDPARAAGVDGTIVFDLGVSDGTRRCWAIDVSRGRARARPGGARQAALTIRLALADFIRVNAGASSFYELIAADRVLIEGDLALAGRLSEIFGARSVY